MTADHRFDKDLPLFWQSEQWQRLAFQFLQGQLAHGFLLTGPQGLGKALFACGFAKFMLCRQPRELSACGECGNCRLSGDHFHPDIIVIKPEEGGRDIKIEQVRALSEFLLRTSHGGGAKIAVIEQAHRLNVSAANALLKTLEEPTERTYLFLISDLPGMLPATIRSRCQRITLSSPSQAEVVDWLKAHFSGDGHEDLNRLARAADCRPLSALTMAEQNSLEQRSEFLDQLGRLSAGAISPRSMVSVAAKIGGHTIIGYLAVTSSILIKYLLINQPPYAGDQDFDALCKLFSARKSSLKVRIRALMRFYEEVSQAGRQLNSGTNPNPQLIVETLMWRWSRLP